MQLSRAFLPLLAAVSLAAQTAEDPQVAQARAQLERTRTLVSAGNLLPSDLQKAEEALADAQDGAILRSSISRVDMTEAEADQLVAAAGRQLDRRKAAFDRAKDLVEKGVAPRLSLDTSLRDLDFARKQCDLAESRARLAREISEQAEAEAAMMITPHTPMEMHGVSERFEGNGIFTPAIFQRIETAFEAHFGKKLPVSAMGETAVHRALGFDHRGRVDVALQPDQPEGVWLREYLTENRIPFFAFRQAVPGKATGAHIHLGPASTRLAAAD